VQNDFRSPRFGGLFHFRNSHAASISLIASTPQIETIANLSYWPKRDVIAVENLTAVSCHSAQSLTSQVCLVITQLLPYWRP
jgi:hypothetical protein